MIRTILVRVLSAGLLYWPAAALTACSAAPVEEARVEQAGTLSLPLSVTVGDHVYRFAYFSIYIYPAGVFLSSSGDPDESVLSTELATGRYQAYVQNWSLQRDDGFGNFVPVQAELISSSYVEFEILNGSATTVSFQFETDGQIITIGSGGLAVVAKVAERAPVCIPLGDDCGEGRWCPPSELIGAPLACRDAGLVELGLACGSPAECVANSSCIDFGAGPVCAALCSSAEFDAACPSGGVCAAVGRDYGVCTPL
jgi:hypothetical protein